jgi:uncharacterized protein (TIGR02996 family)
MSRESELAGLLEAIRERPDEDLPRLALADWCMEQADPLLVARGEFLQLRCRAAALEPVSPQRAALDQRARQLREQHERAWLGGLAEQVAGWDFERGLVVVEVGAGFLWRGRLNRLLARPEWRWVIGVKGVLLNPPDLRRLARSSLAEQLTLLDLTDCEVGSAGADLLAGAKRLQRLTCLRLGYARIADEGAEALAESPVAGRLTTLALPACGIGPAGARALARSRFLARLATLDLSHNLLGLQGARAIAACRDLSNLSRLALNRCRLDDRAASVLAEAPALERLAVLELAGNDVGAAMAEALRERFGERVRL